MPFKSYRIGHFLTCGITKNGIGPSLRVPVRAHADECVAASDPTCSVCGRAPTKSVLTTPMSYLHVEPQPLVAVLCSPVCDSKRCSDDGTAGINQLLSDMMGGMQPGQVSARASRVSRIASCPCGSSRKYKKCCGAATAGDD